MGSRSYGICVSAVIISIIVIFFNLGSIPLLDPDEPVHAETPKEMLLHQEFISPRIYGEYWYDKPPVYYWLVAATYKLFGISDFTARFPSAVLSVLCVIVVMLFGGKMFSARVGGISALILATSIEYFYLGKVAVTDITLTLFLTTSLLCFFKRYYCFFYLFMGLAVLTKGPIVLFFPIVIALLHLVITRNISEINRMKLPLGFLIFGIVALPWYFVMYQIHGKEFIDTFLGFHNLTRFTAPEHPSGVLWYYYIPVIILGFFPWITLLLQSVYHSLTRAKEKFGELIFLNIWVIVVFLFSSATQTKLVSYILPMYPAMALIVGWYIDQLWSERYQQKRQYIWGVLFTVLSILMIGGSYLGFDVLPELHTGLIALIAVLFLMCVCTVYFLWGKDVKYTFISNIIGMIAVSLIVAGLLLPAISPKFSTFDAAQQFEQLYDDNSPIYVSKFLRPGFAFYSGRYGTELIFSQHSVPDIAAILQRDRQAYFILRDIDYARIPEDVRSRLSLAQTVENKMILTIQPR